MSENEYESEIEVLKRQLERERILADSALAKVEYKASVQKNNDLEKLAWVSLLLFCAVGAIIAIM